MFFGTFSCRLCGKSLNLNCVRDVPHEVFRVKLFLLLLLLFGSHLQQTLPNASDRVAAISREPGIPTSVPHTHSPANSSKSSIRINFQLLYVLILSWPGTRCHDLGRAYEIRRRCFTGKWGISSRTGGFLTYSNFGSRSPFRSTFL